MSDLNDLIDELKENREFSANFDKEYEKFKISYLLKEARKKAGMTQEELAAVMHTYKGNISRIENHSEDIKLSTLEKFAEALGRRLIIRLE